jgi:hypothetical protein
MLDILFEIPKAKVKDKFFDITKITNMHKYNQVL